MTFIYGVVAIVLGLGAFIVYAPQIEAWNIYVQYAAKANGEKLKPVPIKERVTPTSHSIKKFKSQLI